MSQKIILCRGLPASGKSTWAKAYCDENPEFVRINKDDIREELGSSHFGIKSESTILKVERSRGIEALYSGRSLIVDDTNLNEKHEKFWSKFASDEGIGFEIKYFDVPVEECIKRDTQRGKSVGRMVIMGMYNKYIKPIL